MNGQSTERTAQPRRGAILSTAACRDGVGRFQVVNGTPDQTTDRHGHAAKRGQRQQRTVAGVLAVSVRGSGVDIQEHHKTRPGRLAGARADLLHQARRISQKHQLVCRDMDTVTPPSRNGLRAPVFAAWRVLTLAGANYIALPQNRTYECPHRPQNRTRERDHRPQNRTYGERNRSFIGPKTVHLLDMPSVGAFFRGQSKLVLRGHKGRRARILEYVDFQTHQKWGRSANTTKWHDGVFVLPDAIAGGDDIQFQASDRTAPYSLSGALEGWKKTVAAHALSNPMLTLGIFAALAGVLLEKLNIDCGGLHLFGDFSAGKTSIAMATTSDWGGPSFRRTWCTTVNDLEGAAKMHTGTLLAFDEAGEVNPRDLYESAYALVNGHERTRANVRGEARETSFWRVFVLSTGEVTIASRSNAGRFESKTGQALSPASAFGQERYGREGARRYGNAQWRKDQSVLHSACSGDRGRP